MTKSTVSRNVSLEHSNVVLINTHDPSKCEGRACTLHNRSDHSMRSFPQHFRSDLGFMERICPHGVGHPDPDDKNARVIHGCDGCCR